MSEPIECIISNYPTWLLSDEYIQSVILNQQRIILQQELLIAIGLSITFCIIIYSVLKKFFY